MIRPPFLTLGNTVAIIAPARKLDENVALGAKNLLESWGFQVKFGNHLFTQEHSYLSANDANRRIDFQELIEDENVQAIFCARGGYGSTRIVDQLNFDKLLSRPKWIIGFSDITSIHLKLQSIGIESIHGTMPVLFTSEEHKTSVNTLKALLFGTIPCLQAKYDDLNRMGEANAPLLGGNLSLLVDSLGTASALDTRGKILVIEEVGESFYKIDRMLVQLKRANKLSTLAGLVVGHFTDITESTLAFGESIQEIVRHHTLEYSYPIAFNFPIGHYQPNLPFIQGGLAKLSVTPQGSTLLSLMNE
jgi:muramoyltetrapeptide carboxypeptidase